MNIDSNTGAVSDQVPGGANPPMQPNGQILFHPSGKFVYALDTRSGSQVVELYSVDATTGALTFVNTQLNGTLVNPIFSSSGDFLYGCGQTCPAAYRVDSNTGALTPIAGFSLGAGRESTLILDKTGKYAYSLDLSTQSSIFVYSVDSSTGLMTQIPGLTITVPTPLETIVAGR